MNHLILIVVLFFSLGSLHGCGSRLQHNDAVADKLGDEAFQCSAGEQSRVLRQQADLLEQIEGYTVRFDVAVEALMPDNNSTGTTP